MSRLGLESQVRFLGPLHGEEKDKALEGADLFVLPTHSENFGVAVAEAMAAGIPVITTRGAPWEVLEERDCGWWVDVSVDALAAALKDSTGSDAAKLGQMGRRGRQVARELFGWSSIAEEMERCYSWILGQGPEPTSILSGRLR